MLIQDIRYAARTLRQNALFTTVAVVCLALAIGVNTMIFSVIDGTFDGGNPDLDRDITLVENDPYEGGWLFQASGAPDASHCDAEGYAAILDTTIDAMLASRHDLNGEGE